MSDNRYTLDLQSLFKDDLDTAVRHMMKEKIIPNILSVESELLLPNGTFNYFLSSEYLHPNMASEAWDYNDHEKFFHELSKKIPSVFMVLSIENLDDPENSMIKKAFHDGQYKEVFLDRLDLDRALDAAPWRPYGAPETDIAKHSTRYRGIDLERDMDAPDAAISMPKYSDKLSEIPWGYHKDEYYQAFDNVSQLFSVLQMTSEISAAGGEGGVKQWASKYRLDSVTKPQTKDDVYLSGKKGIEQMLTFLQKFAMKVFPAEEALNVTWMDRLIHDFKAMKIRYPDKSSCKGAMLTGAAAFEDTISAHTNYLQDVLCEAYAQFMYKSLERDMEHDPRLIIEKPFIELLTEGIVQSDSLSFYKNYWQSHPCGKPLQEFLGMTENEYVAVDQRGEEVLTEITNARREGRNYEGGGKRPIDESLASAKARANAQSQVATAPEQGLKNARKQSDHK